MSAPVAESTLGFYDLSDLSSCSISNSCTSVYSECLPSACKGVKPCSQKCGNNFKISRPRSTDEKSMCVSPDVSTRDTHEKRTNSGPSNIQGKGSQRPVSTGDLERFIQMYHAFQINSDHKSKSTFDIKNDINFQCMDPKYQTDLVSKNRNEVYTYPSPLHAVALQSPLFPLSTGSQKYSTENNNSKNMFELSPGSGLSAEMELKGNINKLLEVIKCQETEKLDFFQETIKRALPALPHKELISQCCLTSINNSIFQRQKQVSSIEGDMKDQEHTREIELKSNAKQNPIISENLKITLPVPNPSLSTSHLSTIYENKLISLNHFAKKALQASDQTISHTSPKVHSPQKGVCATKNFEPCEFVQAKFIPAESRQVKITVSTSKNILINGKRRNHEKTPSPVHIVEQPKLKAGIRLKDECIEHCKSKAGRKRSIKRPTFLVSAAHRSYSKDSLYPDQCRNPSTSQADVSSKILYSSRIMEHQNHMVHSWKSAVDNSDKKHNCNFYRSPQTVWVKNRKPMKKAGAYRYMDLNDQSESEYSGECASLFHSTVIDTSNEVSSEYNANRFGDLGSSDSDSTITTSDSSLSLKCESLNVIELKWAGNTSKTPAAPKLNRHSQPEPMVCRIKASQALKKKIRRFHPASLKIITMI
ncbi:dapper homolog 2 [Aquarana catesbeiana]|uniref:dapper homolog 2 n=1 Tax=Aquarana catesbeiana TaxID=8400 RepID=UPI003CCA1AF5